MAFFKSDEQKLIESLQDEQLYELVAIEVANQNIRLGLWAKACAESAGDDARTKATYLKLRVAQVKLGIDVTAEMLAKFEKQQVRIRQESQKPKVIENPWKVIWRGRCGCGGTVIHQQNGKHNDKQCDKCEQATRWTT